MSIAISSIVEPVQPTQIRPRELVALPPLDDLDRSPSSADGQKQDTSTSLKRAAKSDDAEQPFAGLMSALGAMAAGLALVAVLGWTFVELYDFLASTVGRLESLGPMELVRVFTGM